MASDKKEERKNPWDKTSKASDLHRLQKLKALIYGPSGSGKSRIASLFNRVLIGVTEHQAIPTIAETNPNAIVKLISNSQELREFKEMICDPSLPEKVDAVCLDSLTDAQRILKAFYLAKQSSGGEIMEIASWGLLVDSTARLAREVRDLPVHVVVTCLSEEESVTGVGITHRPAVYGKRLPNDLAQYFNLVGFTHVNEYERGMRHEVMFRGSDRWLTKGMTKLDNVEPPEPLLWISKVFGEELDDETTNRVKAWRKLAIPLDMKEED